MSRDSTNRRSAGFALMAALFIIVTLAAIGTYLVTVSTGQVAAASQDEQAARAYQAARAGIDVATYQVLRLPPPCPASQTLALGHNLQGFQVQVDCTLIGNETEAGNTVEVYRITATGCNANPCSPASPPATYVERQLQLTLTRMPP
jgi:MSHA biogenesis protein MshP